MEARRFLVTLAAGLSTLATTCRAEAQHVPRETYLRYVPIGYPSIVRATPETERFGLYDTSGVSEYVDVNPKNGIEDRRDAWLLALSVRFSPFMVRNTTSVPMDWKRFIRSQRDFPLTIDTWNVARSPATLTATNTIDFKRLDQGTCADDETSDDCALERLSQRFDPDSTMSEWAQSATMNPERQPFSVLFFDFPGDGPTTWHEEYNERFSHQLPPKYRDFAKIYSHPFISRRTDSRVDTYELVLQYWFFYPFNDGGNKHAGDWEHVNVVVSPRSLVTRGLYASELEQLLRRPIDAFDGADPLVIKRVEYYFHHNVMTLDYAHPNAYASRDHWKHELPEAIGDRAGEKRIFEEIRRRAFLDEAETKINTHPIAFIGGDSKGLELLLQAPGSKNRDSHGTYPLRGLYKDIGPAASAEEIDQGFDLREHFGAKTKPWPENVARFDDAKRIEVLPDWERVMPLIRDDPESRREWTWMTLPVHWGYPATISPFAGVVSHADTGNLSPFGPTFNGGWNGVGATSGYSTYLPHRIPRTFPISPLDAIRNSWGFANIPALALLNLPPLDLVFKLLPAPLLALAHTQSPMYYPKDAPPRRVVGLGIGVTTQFLSDNDWPQLFFNTPQQSELFSRLGLGPGGPNATVEAVNSFADNPTSPVFQLVFYLSDHFSAENTFRYAGANVGADLVLRPTNDSAELRGRIHMYEWQGSIRYSFLPGRFQPYVKLGYGLSWYRLEDVTVNGTPLSSSAPWIRKPSLVPFHNLLPNTWHYGAGIEFLVIDNPQPLGFGASIKAEFVMQHHSLGLSTQERAFLENEGGPFIARPAVNAVLMFTL
ncbi:hypothetical protein AKJ09_01286 [Labilithrix luteola]|uniref:Uncharacterized protein n=1 Tax=Labilithrix luteola TaxID=1391654 RepID=A0A0K1PM73_9BACT|nr:hypothetical protein AKJ09_01286 [Labilithrix luteola]